MPSLAQTVIAEVRKRGSATVDDLMPVGEYTRKQVIAALRNATADGWLDCAGHTPTRGEGVGQGSVPSTYTAREERKAKPPRKRKKTVPHPIARGGKLRRSQVPSVFHLAAHPLNP